jgi:hypothetical protein
MSKKSSDERNGEWDPNPQPDGSLAETPEAHRHDYTVRTGRTRTDRATNKVYVIYICCVKGCGATQEVEDTPPTGKNPE